MSIIYVLVGTNRALRHSNSNNQIVIGDFNSFRFFWDTLYRTQAFKLEQQGEFLKGFFF
jgi:hypothetical protein